MKRKLLLLFLVLCMVLPLMPTTLAYGVGDPPEPSPDPVVPTVASYVSGGTYVSGIDYTCLDSSDADITGSVDLNYMETRTGYPSEGRIRLEQSYYLNVPSDSDDVTVTFTLSGAASGMTLNLDDPYYYDTDNDEYINLEDGEYEFNSSTNILTLTNWNGYNTNFSFHLTDYKEIINLTIYSERTINASDTCTVLVKNPLEGLSTDVPIASGSTIQFYSVAAANHTMDFDNITYHAERWDDKSMTGITIDYHTGILTLSDSAEPGLVRVYANHETTDTNGYNYLVISETGKYGYASYVSYSDENNDDNYGYLEECLVTLTKGDATVQSGTSLSDGFVWMNNITDYDGNVTITGAKDGYQDNYSEDYTAYKCSTASYISMVIPEVVETFFSGGSGTSEDPYQISTVLDLEELEARVNVTADAFSGKYFTLTADLDLNNYEWTPIGTSTTPFSGIFDGGEHTISNLSINSSSSDQGLFGYVEGGHIKNLSVIDSTIRVSGDFYNVGGIVGYLYHDATIDNCDFSGTVSGNMGVGGIVGYVSQNAPITNCSFNGTVSGESYIGGIAGVAFYSESIEYCKNSGTVIGTGDYVGGIVGSGEYLLTIQYCYNTGNVSGVNYGGGIIGYNNQGTVSSCYNLGDITTEFSVTGGIAGSNEGLIEYCYNTGYISNSSYNGGISGSNSGTVQYCYNIGDLESSDLSYWGLIIGENTGTVQNCYYDTQMTWSGGSIGSSSFAVDDTVNHVEGKATADMLGDLFSDTTHWTIDSNLYPRLADPSGSTFDMDTTDVAYVSVAPIHFSDGECIWKVTKDFTVGTNNGVSWSSQDSDLISITGSDATVIKGDTDTYEWGITLTASLNEASRNVYYVNPYSDDAGITSILSESITAGSEAGTSGDPITASINVANSVSTVLATDIVGAADSVVEFYGTDNTFTTAEAGSVALTADDTTTVYIKVTAQDGVTIVYYAVAITRATAATSSDSNLTSVLGETISTEGSGGTVEFPITTLINVANSVSDVAATDIVGAIDSTVVFYGTDSTFTTVESGSVALTAGSSTIVYIKVTAQDGTTVGYYEVEIARAADASSNSYFLITKSSPEDSSTATSYYYVYSGTSETSLSSFSGSYADSVSNTAYSTLDLAITDIEASAASSSVLYFAATGNTIGNADGTLNTGDNSFTLTSGTYTIKGAVEINQGTSANGLLKLEGASVIIDGATIESEDLIGIRNNGDGSVTVNSGTISALSDAIYSEEGSVIVNGGTIFGTNRAIHSLGTGNIVINSGTITSDDNTILLGSSSSGNLTVNGGSIVSNFDGNAIDFNGSGDLTIIDGKVYSLAGSAVDYDGSGELIISGDLWNDTAQTGTLLSSDGEGRNSNALFIGSNVTSAEITGGTLLSEGVTVYVESDTSVSGGLIQAADDMPAMINDGSTLTINGGTITSSNMNMSLDFSDLDNIKFPGTVFSSSTGITAKLYISEGTISNTAETGYAIANCFFSSGSDTYLSGTPSISGNTATLSSYNSIYVNDGNGTYYSGSPVSLYYSDDITAGSTVAVSGVSAGTNDSLFSLVNEGYLLQVFGTDLKIEAVSGSSLLSILSQSITAGSETGTSADPITASISVANSVSDVAVTDIVGATDSTVVFYGLDSTFTTPESLSVVLPAGSSTTVYIKVTAQEGVTVSYYKVEIAKAAATTSSDSHLTSVLGKTISTEGSGGTPAFPITTDINVANSVSSVAATDIAGATDSIVVFYGTDNTFTTAEAGSVALTAGSSTTVYIKVTAQDGVTVAYYTVDITRAAAATSNDSNLTSVLGETISTEGSGGSVAFPIRTDINVSNSVSDVEATDIVGAADSAVVFYGTDSTFTTAEAGSVALTAGSSTTVYIKVTAQDGVTVGYYEVEIARAAATSSGGSSGGSSDNDTPTTTPIPTQPSQENVVVIVNGETQDAGKETTTIQDGKTIVTVEMDNKVIESKIDEAIKNNNAGTGNVIQVPVADTKSDVVKVELTGDIVKKLETNTFDVSVKRDNIEYIIPAEEFTISKVAENLGVSEKDLEDIKVEVQITKLDQNVVDKYNEVARVNGAELVFPPVAFEVVAKTTKADGTTGEVEISKFSNYVERVMEIPAGVDPSKITTGIVFNPDGTYSHVPTEVFQKDGKWYASLNSLTNSNYSVIWNPVTVKSVENHWSKDTVNDMASRLIIFNSENFEPDKAITRADFAEYIIRALGLFRESSVYENKFSDVGVNNDRKLAILIAGEYGIIAGYPDGTFRPDALITREEAMAMYQRAMNITKLVGTDKNRYQSFTDFTQASSWASDCIKEVLAAHVFNGTAPATISPKSNLTYAEAAQAIKNLLEESKLINK